MENKTVFERLLELSSEEIALVAQANQNTSFGFVSPEVYTMAEAIIALGED